MTAAHARPPVIGLDLGGTKNAAALVGGGGTVLVGGGGTVLARHARPTPAREGAEAVLDAPAEAARAVRAPDATAIGVAAAGVIDPVTGTVTSATDTIHGWAGTALATGLADRTGLPVACDNDVRATATTELPRTGRAPAPRWCTPPSAPAWAAPSPSADACCTARPASPDTSGTCPARRRTGCPAPAAPPGTWRRSRRDPPSPPTTRGGRIATPDQAAEALAAGAHSVVVGTAITAPTALTRAFVAALPA